MSKTKEPSEADIVFNRANIALAQNQRLVASWLPARTDAELSSTKSQEELEREEEEMFAPVPELLGVGAVVSKDKNGLPRRSEASALDKLRTQLTGKNATAASLSANKPIVSRPQAAPIAGSEKQAIDEDSDDEEGRAGALSNRRKSKAHGPAKKDSEHREETQSSPELDIQETKEQITTLKVPREHTHQTKSKRASNFMDELLQQKGKKKKRR